MLRVTWALWVDAEAGSILPIAQEWLQGPASCAFTELRGATVLVGQEG